MIIKRNLKSECICFNKSGKFISIPVALVSQALKRVCDDIPHMYFTVSFIKNNGYQLCFSPSTRDDAKTKPFKGWRSNSVSKRYHISAVSILDAIGIRRRLVVSKSFKGEGKDGRIVVVLPKEIR